MSVATPTIHRENTRHGSSDPPAESATRRSTLAGAISLLNFGIKCAAPIAVIPLCQSHLGSSEYGLWILVQSVMLYITLSEAGLGQTIVNHCGAAYAVHDIRRVNEIQTTAFVAYCLMIVPVAVACLLVLVSFPPHVWLVPNAPPELQATLQTAMLVGSLLVLGRIPLFVFKSVLIGLRQQHLQLTFEVCGAVVMFTAIIVGLKCGARTIALVWITGLTQLLPPLVSLVWLRWRHPEFRVSPKWFRPKLLIPLWENSAFFFLMSLAYLLDRSAGQLLVGYFDTLAAVPLMFAVLSIFRTAGWSIIYTLSHVLQPFVIMWAARGEWRLVHRQAAISTSLSVTISLAFSAAVWLLGRPLCTALLGPSAVPDPAMVGMLATTFVIESLFVSGTNFAVALNRHRLLAILSVIRAVLMLTFGALGCYLFPERMTAGIAGGFLVAIVIGQLCTLPFILPFALRLGLKSFCRDFLLRPVCLAACILPVIALADARATSLVERSSCAAILVVIICGVSWRFLFDRSQRDTVWRELTRVMSRIGIQTPWGLKPLQTSGGPVPHGSGAADDLSRDV